MKRIACYILILFSLTACSTKKNTAGTRFWQSFTTKYNTYYNGSEAYKEGMAAKIMGNTDDYTQLLPFFLVGNEKSAALGKSNFETAILKAEKSIQLHSIKKKPEVNPNKRSNPKVRQFLARNEYNPFLKNAWLLMGKSQFQKGEFMEAAATFNYIARLYKTEPDVANEARAWLARCYAAENWYYDAEDIINKLRRDSLTRNVRREMTASQADLLLRQERYADALPYLRQAAKQARGKQRQARLYFLLGQTEQLAGNEQAAYKALQRCIRKSPPYQLALNARILQTEVVSQNAGTAKKRQLIGKLRRMARSDNNKEYLDQIYYAIGNIHLSQNDTVAAIQAYETGRAKATRSGTEKGVLLLRLGQVYWEQRRFDKAQSAYSEALGMIDKSRKDYAEITRRSKVLDKLVPYTSAVYLQDSLQALSRMSETDRNAAIDRVIEALKKKEKEELRAKRDSAAQARMQENAGNNSAAASPTQKTAEAKKDQTWYFYNPMLVQQGKQDFQKQWGNRKNEDNWRRSNKTVIQMEEDVDETTADSIAAAQDSIEAAEAAGDTIVAPENDPHSREYYLAQIPFTAEQKEASNLIIMDGLYNAGIIEKDELEDFPLASETLERIVRQYPTFERLLDTYYQLFLLYSRWGRTAEANRCKNLMARQFPDSTVTQNILDPDYLYNARYGRQIEDSLYTATYDAYRFRDRATVESNFRISSEKYPTGQNRPKFIFLHALNRLGTASGKDVADELRNLVKQYPQSDVSEMAGMIVNGLEAGRTPGSGGYNLGSLWERRTAQRDSVSSDSLAKGLTAERNTKFVFLIAYPKDSINDNELLYNLAHFNFCGFYVRNFDIEKVLDYGTELVRDTIASNSEAAPKQEKNNKQRLAAIVQFRIHGFRSYDEAHAYAQEIYHTAELPSMLEKAHVFLISESNLELMGRQYSFADYQQFFDSCFAPLPVAPKISLDVETEPVEQRYEEKIEQIYPREIKEKDLPKEEQKQEEPTQQQQEQPQENGEPTEPDLQPDEEEFFPAEPAETDQKQEQQADAPENETIPDEIDITPTEETFVSDEETAQPQKQETDTVETEVDTTEQAAEEQPAKEDEPEVILDEDVKTAAEDENDFPADDDEVILDEDVIENDTPKVNPLLPEKEKNSVDDDDDWYAE